MNMNYGSPISLFKNLIEQCNWDILFFIKQPNLLILMEFILERFNFQSYYSMSFCSKLRNTVYNRVLKSDCNFHPLQKLCKMMDMKWEITEEVGVWGGCVQRTWQRGLQSECTSALCTKHIGDFKNGLQVQFHSLVLANTNNT